MKLIHMHVDNFGCLHNYDYEFEDGLNVILHDNGWGKTTIAAFLKAMLYGFESKRSKNITENERKRYLPWQGGKYGGTLDFEAEGVRYRLSRTFGETPRFDKAKILKLDGEIATAAKLDAEKVGETLFRLDASAFQRSVFINQNGLSVDGASSSIHTRLNALVSQANDVAAYDDAIAKLTQQIKVYEKTGARGRLGDITRQIAAQECQRDKLEADIAAQDSARERISQIDMLLNDISKELEEKKKRLDEVSGEARKREASEQMLEDLNRQMTALQQQIDAIKADLGGNVPDDADMDQVKKQSQAVSALLGQLDELEKSHTKMAETYSALLEMYNGAIPTAAQLDELQSMYGELQGILSVSHDATDIIEAEPEEYSAVKAVLEMQPDYIGRLQRAAGAQMTIQQLVRRLEDQDSEMEREAQTWADKKKRYENLASEAERLQAEVNEQSAYAPAVIEPIISSLSEQQKKQRKLMQQAAEQEIAVGRERDSWAEKKQRYTAIKEERNQLRAELACQARFKAKTVRPVISKLDELYKQQQLVDARREELSDEALTAEQEAMLLRCPRLLPDAAEGSAILKKFRNVAKQEAEIQGLSSRLEGEKTRAESLKASLAQMHAMPESNIALVEKPKKSSGTVMIGVGAAVTVVGLILAVTGMPVFAAVAVLGIVLAAAGIVTYNGYKTKVQAYEAYQANCQANAAQQQEIQKKKADVQAQMDAVTASIAELQSQIAELNTGMEAEREEVSAWMAKWAPSATEISESEINNVIDTLDQVRRLHKKKQDLAEKQNFITEKTVYIEEERQAVESAYPEIVGKTFADALELLRQAETEYKIKDEKLQAAERNLQKCIADDECAEGLFIEKPSEQQVKAQAEIQTEIQVETLLEELFSADESPRTVELQQQLEQIYAALAAIDAEKAEIHINYPEISSMSYEEALNFLRAKESSYKVADSQLQTAVRSKNEFVAESGIAEEQFACAKSPRIDGLAENRAAAASELNQAIGDCNEVLVPLGLAVTPEDVSAVLRRAEQMIHVYQQYADKKKDRVERQQKQQQQMEQLQHRLTSGAVVLQGCYEELEMPERLAQIREDGSDAAKLMEKLAENEQEQIRQKTKLDETEKSVHLFLETFGHFKAETDDALAEIYAKAANCEKLEAAKKQLEKQRAAVCLENSGVAASAGSEEETTLRTKVTELEECKDNLLVEYTRKSDFIRQADQSLEQYPNVVQEIRELYDQKQKAQNTLAMLKRTIQLITKAKENLANRYLSKVEQLFNHYMHIWLNNDAVRGILDIDFHIMIEEKEKIHVAEGYSTGYCDLIDFCMRLALVDTLFESEHPFLILDDPFVNLDAERLDKALELLHVMAANKQIVYFVCHPIRAIEMDETSSSRSEFVRLAEETRRSIEERGTARTERKKPVRKSPREMYRIVDSDTIVAIKPAKPNYTITNNIFSMNFVLNDVGMPKDVSYELFFIDAVGHVLNDRQLIEIKDGKLSAERIQFCLNTRDDSGEQFELMIRESGQDDYEVAARIPFRAKLAFAGTFSFDF